MDENVTKFVNLQEQDLLSTHKRKLKRLLPTRIIVQPFIESGRHFT